MKKIFFSIVAITTMTALSACGNVTIEIGDFVPNPGGKSNSLRLDEYSVTTSHKTSVDVKDQNGNTIPKNSYVICDNLNTVMNIDLKWTGYLDKLYVQFNGLTTERTKGLLFQSTSNGSAGQAAIQYNLAPGTAPLNINPQGIIVKPIRTVKVLGNTYVQMQGVDNLNRVSNVLQTATAFPVVKCGE